MRRPSHSPKPYYHDNDISETEYGKRQHDADKNGNNSVTNIVWVEATTVQLMYIHSRGEDNSGREPLMGEAMFSRSRGEGTVYQ